MNPLRSASKTARHSRAASRRPLALLPLLVGCALAAVSGAVAAADGEQWVPGRLLVQPKPGLPDSELAKILKVHGGKSVGKIEGIDVHIVHLPVNASEKAVAALLAKNPHVKFAERDMVMSYEATANDTYFANGWQLTKTGATTAWDTSTGTGVVIAILDSGIDLDHPDLVGQILPGWNFYSGNSDLTDVTGHGTQVAGTAAAATNNGAGVASIAGGAKILPLRITDPTGSALYSTMATATTYAADHGARVANISYGGARSSSTVQSAASYMKSKGGLVTVSAGNAGTQELVAASDAVIAVSATTSGDVKASWSSYGAYVDVAAPGASVWSTNNGGGYGAISGTSIASPVAAGVIALMMSANPALSSSQVEQLLFSTAKDLGTAGWDSYYGWGRVDAAAAVAAAKTAVVADTSAPSVSLTSPGSGSIVKGLVSVSVSATDNIGVSRVELHVNGVKIASDISAPYGFSWDSTTVPDGGATLTAYAYDAAGNYSSAVRSVTVDNIADTVAPTATISNPANGAKVSGSVSVSTSASDNVGISKVTLYVDGQQVATANASSLSYNWNTRKAASGNHVLRVEAVDTSGNLGSTSISVSK
jgi:subtilisin family serine protease